MEFAQPKFHDELYEEVSSVLRAIYNTHGQGAWKQKFMISDRIADSFFFFQAADGIRDGHVTGVQTCALPIFGSAEIHCSSQSMNEGGDPLRSGIAEDRAALDRLGAVIPAIWVVCILDLPAKIAIEVVCNAANSAVINGRITVAEHGAIRLWRVDRAMRREIRIAGKYIYTGNGPLSRSSRLRIRILPVKTRSTESYGATDKQNSAHGT